jgi:predicted amidophosphoribosyltransferase
VARTRLTAPQKEVASWQLKRLNDLNGFRLAKPLKLSGKRVLLIDDFLASGAILNETSAVLRECGAEKIHAPVLARTRFGLESGSAH